MYEAFPCPSKDNVCIGQPDPRLKIKHGSESSSQQLFPLPNKAVFEGLVKTNMTVSNSSASGEERSEEAASEATTDIPLSELSEPSSCNNQRAVNTPLSSLLKASHQDQKSCLAFKRVFISMDKGYGLVATRFIEKGEIIIHERALFMDHLHCRVEEKEKVKWTIAAKLRSEGEEFTREFFKYQPSRPPTSGPLVAIWDDARIPITNSKANVIMSVVGHKMRWINHACVANCHVFLTFNDVVGERLATTAKIQALNPISEGQEITVSYEIFSSPLAIRQKLLETYLHCPCQCDFCAKPNPPFEKLMNNLMLLDLTLTSEEVKKNKPASGLQHALEMIETMKCLQINDSRFAEISVQCAILCGYHSDRARASYFVKLALRTLTDNGIYGVARTNLLFKYLHDSSCMPGFGTTMRGNSDVDDIRLLLANPERHDQILYMLDADKDEYIALRDYYGLRTQCECVRRFGWIKRHKKITPITEIVGAVEIIAVDGPASSPSHLSEDGMSKLMKETQGEKKGFDQGSKIPEKKVQQKKRKRTKGRQNKASTQK